jgi:hypothetical protein
MTGYSYVPNRIAEIRGKAKEHKCIDGCGRQAEQWSYNHCAGEHELTQSSRRATRSAADATW